MGDATLKKLASELTEKLRSSTTVDWQFREIVRAKMRILIRQLLRKYKYPPEGCEEALGWFWLRRRLWRMSGLRGERRRGRKNCDWKSQPLWDEAIALVLAQPDDWSSR